MHPRTLVYIQGLALRIDGLGIDEEAALELYIESLEGYRSVGGDDDPRVLALLAEIADHLFDDLERYDEAELYLEELIPLQRRTLGYEHSDTLESISLMCSTLFKQEKHDEAEPYFAERLALSRRLHGNDDPVTLSAMNMMGRILRLQGKYDEAEAHYIECIDARRRTLGDDNPDTLTTISNLAYLLMKQERYDEAVPIQLEVLVGRRRVLGEAHTSSISSLKRVISLFKALHRAKSGAGYDRIAAKYQSQLDAIEAEKANEPEPAAP
jgi:tetratricopeptide (TPR) repeat protein